MPDKTIEAQIELREDIGIPLTVELTGENVREVRKIARSGGRDRVLFDGAKLADGRYTLKVRCEKNGRELAASVKIRKLPYRKGEVWLDARGVTHVDGVPFLPYGWYGTHGKRKACYNSCYVKFKGLNPRFHVFFVFSRFLNSFLSFEDKNPPSAISCSPFYVKLFLLYFSIKKSDTVIGGGLIIIRSPTRMGPQLVGVGLLCV